MELLKKINEQYKHIMGDYSVDNVSFEKILEHIVNYYENIISCMPGNVYWLDKNCITLGCNKNVLDMFGFKSLKEFKGLSFEEMGKIANWSKTAEQSFKKDTLEVINTGKSKLNVEEPPIPHADGRTLYFLSSRVPLFDHQNNVIGIVGISVDITDRKLAEEREKQAIAQAAEEKARAEAETELRQAVTVLAGSIAHDLRTPIALVEMEGNFINKFLPALIDAYHKAKAANLILIENEIENYRSETLEKLGKSIQETARQMQEFINVTLKTISKVLKGELTQEDLSSCSIWHCIHNTLTRYPFSEKQRALVKWDQQDFDFMGNELLIIRIFSNLLNNSLQQITKNQRGEIFISTEKNDTENLIRFKDTAGGASPEIVAHLFDGYRTTKEKGTGVGLAFCRLAMQNFGGNIKCHSVEGDYIEFILTFPKK